MSNVSNAELLRKAREDVKASKGYQRITALFDEGTFNEVDGLAKSGDGYAEVVAGYGLVADCPVYAFAQNRYCRRCDEQGAGCEDQEGL